jgi:hypothetical protein
MKLRADVQLCEFATSPRGAYRRPLPLGRRGAGNRQMTVSVDAQPRRSTYSQDDR